MLSGNPRGRHNYEPHFTNEENVGHRGNWPRSRGYLVVQQELEHTATSCRVYGLGHSTIILLDFYKTGIQFNFYTVYLEVCLDVNENEKFFVKIILHMF